jgi:23S rRNA G2069 N7-methylase RlmK/C1962 C5-methylase RlmI
MDAKTAAQAEMLANRLVKRFRHLSKWARRREVEAFRLYDRDIPEIPLVLDWYKGAVSGALFRRPYEKDEAEERLWLDAMVRSASDALGILPGGIFIKYRERKRGKAQYEKTAGPEAKGFTLDVREGDLLFRVNLSDYLDTGLFLDRRKLRRLVRGAAKGKRVLNLFSYTCAFSVSAAAGGAVLVDSVDLSNTYLAWGAENFALNGFRACPGRPGEGKALTLIPDDVLSFIVRAKRAGFSWDLVILDPPAFSNSKKMKASLDIRRDHRELIERCLALLAPGGALLFAAARRFRPDAPPGTEFEDLGDFAADEDIPPARAPFCFMFRRKGASILEEKHPDMA